MPVPLPPPPVRPIVLSVKGHRGSGQAGNARTLAARESGQGTVEYTGLAVVIAIILGALLFSAPSWGSALTSTVDRIICDISKPLSGGECGDGESHENLALEESGPDSHPGEDTGPQTAAALEEPGIPDARLEQELVDEAVELFERAIAEDATGADIRALREHLADLSSAEIRRLSAQHPNINRYSMPVPRTQEQLASFPTGTEGASWWNDSLTEEQGTALAQYMPLMIGNVEGVDYETRNEANLNALAFLRGHEGTTAAQQERLDQIASSMLDPTGQLDENRYLLSLNMGHPRENSGRWYNPFDWGAAEEKHWPDPLAAVSVGNPDTTETTSFNIAGMGSNTDNMPTEVRRAQGLYDGLDETHAVISWIGYDPPSTASPSVWSSDLAEAGGYALAYALDGYQQTRATGGDSPAVFLNCHSYGTNTCNHALMNNQETVAGLTMYGSSGIPQHLFEEGVPPVQQLNVATYGESNLSAVFATESPDDFWAPLGRNPLGLGIIDRYNPAQDSSYGAQIFYSDGERGNIKGEGVHGHGQNEYDHPERYGYLDPDSQSYETMILILQGLAEEVEFK